MWTGAFFQDDGKLADANTMDDRFTEAKSWIDALTGASSRRGTFNPSHAASPLDDNHGVTNYSRYGDDATHRYTRVTFGTDILYPGFGIDTGTDSAPLPGLAANWVVVGHPSQSVAGYGDGPALLEYTPAIDVTTTGPVQAILVLANVEVFDLDTTLVGAVFELAFCIQVEHNASWRTVATSERVIRPSELRMDPASDEKVLYDVAIVTLITYNVLALKATPPTGVTGIRLMMSMIDPANPQRVDLRRWNLTALPLRCKVV